MDRRPPSLFVLLFLGALLALPLGCARQSKQGDADRSGLTPRGGETLYGRAERAASVRGALRWLADHQMPEGYWDADAFMLEDKQSGEPRSDGPGNPLNDVGVTGMALLAFLGDGHTTIEGQYRDVVRKGVRWLREVQGDAGLFGAEVGNATIYNHGIATAATAEAYRSSGRSPMLRPHLESAVEVIEAAHNPYRGWRYSLTPNGDSDTIVTGWMLTALRTAREGSIDVDEGMARSATAWLQELTDPETGRTGYALDQGGRGGTPSRNAELRRRFPPHKSEAPTAVALRSRILYGGSGRGGAGAAENAQQVRLMLENPPVWDPAGGSCDYYYWLWGTLALSPLGGAAWESWRDAVDGALIPNQRQDGNFAGSWDPVGPWGQDGGRIYATATAAIVLETTNGSSRLVQAD